VRTKLIEVRAEVELYESQGEELWGELPPVCCRCRRLVELRRGNGQRAKGIYTTNTGVSRESGPLCHVEYYNGGDAWVPYEYCVGAHSANGPTVRREDYDEHGERVDDFPTI